MIIGSRLRQLRLAQGYSLEVLAGHMGGIVTKQALSKYEVGKAQPTVAVLNKLAAALRVKSASLGQEPDFRVRFHGFRKTNRLRKQEKERIESLVAQLLEYRVRLQLLYPDESKGSIPIRGFETSSFDDVETAAGELRDKWNLGLAPIANVTDTLEEHGIHVLELAEDAAFDGLSATAVDQANSSIAAAVVTRMETSGERQRFSLLHELAHLITKQKDNLDAEKAAHRFAGAFLAPSNVLLQNVGKQRHHVSLSELLLLKQKFGMSLQALLFRMRDLKIISETVYRRWCIEINSHGWKREEPGQLPREQAKWFRQTLLRAVTESLITKDEAEEMLGETIDSEEPLSMQQRRAFMKLPLEHRRRIMEKQAQELAAHYEDRELKDLDGGDIIEY